MSISKARKEKLIQKYMTNDIPEITPYQKEWARKKTANFIFVDKDEKGNHICRCTACEQTINIGKTKHKGKATCPICDKEMQVLHKWRILKWFPTSIDWVIIPRAIDKDTFMLRYILVHRNSFDSVHIDECARLVIDLRGKHNYHTFEKMYVEGWKYKASSYFKRWIACYQENSWFCMNGIPYTPTWKREFNKLDGVKYFIQANELYKKLSKSWYPQACILLVAGKASLYEKMYKVGLDKLVNKDIEATGHDWSNIIVYKTKEKSLTKMLGISKLQLEILKRKQDLDVLRWLQTDINMSEEKLDSRLALRVSAEEISKIKRSGFGFEKVINYLSKQRIVAHEWLHYMDMLKSEKYPLDNSYLFPKNFHEKEMEVIAEIKAIQDARRAAEEEARRKEREARNAIITDKIAKISASLRNNKELIEFFKGSDGLQVFVPESPEELIREGINLHNCLRTYTDRIANGDTLIFFIRRMEDPTASYIAMEYCHGRAIQIRFDYNQPVKDEKIINFADRLVKKLVEQNILAA